MAMRVIEKFITFIFDILAINVAFITAFWLRYKSNIFPESYDPALELVAYTTPAIVMTIIWLVLYFFTGLYRDWYKESRLDEFFVVARTVLLGMFLIFLIITASQIIDFVKTGDARLLFTRAKLPVLLTYGGCMLFFASVNRFAMHTLLSFLFTKGIAVNKVLIIGANSSSSSLIRDLANYPQQGYKVLGIIDNDKSKKNELCEGHSVLGTYDDLLQIIKDEKVHGIIISHVSTSADEISKILEHCGDSRIVVYMVPSLMDVITGHLKTHQLFGVPLMVLLQDHMPAWEAQIKRLVDIAVSLSVLIFGSPFLVFTALLVKLSSKGPAVYSQERVGQNGKTYVMYKFRSMYVDAEKRSGPQWASKNDPRITPVGRFIRKTRLDELPQFYNVLKGEMSLVGPRPERPFFVEQLKKEIPWYVRRIKMKPGITGWAQVKHKYDSSIEDVKQKVLFDLYYFENMSLMLDLKIILRTFIVVLTGKGAH
jgi:exopolysaccharide biosynthesis polyprenyl glycosylphosphotransferase